MNDNSRKRREWERKALPALPIGIGAAFLWEMGLESAVIFFIYWTLMTLIIRQQQEPKPPKDQAYEQTY